MAEEREQPVRGRSPRRSRAGPTVNDVAREAGVSPMTVSRVVNRESGVRPATREKVERVITALGYVPNAAARGLAGGKQCRVALLYSNPSASYLSEFLVGSLEGAAEYDAQLMIEHWDGESVDALVQRFEAHRIDAILLPPPLCENAALLATLKAASIPVAQVATGDPSPAAHAVSISDVAAAHAMTSHLIGLGHRRIGFIAGNPNQSASRLRRLGYEEALRDAGVPVEPLLIEPGDFTYRSGLTAAERLLALEDPPTAIFASNDDMAAAVVSAAHRRHLDVPLDLSVCGYDDTAMATTIWPELTTIRQPVAEMAHAAMQLLTQAVRATLEGKPLAPQHRRLDLELVVRDSSAVPRSLD